jgi:hypothetical protein
MNSLLDKTLAFWLEVEVEFAKLHYPGTSRKALLNSVLVEFQERGFASRCVRSNGKIGWKATGRLHEYLRDQELDATDDLDHAD